jgi:flagellar motor switch protein FliM
MSIEHYNFHKPGRLAGDLEHRLMAWLGDACSMAPDKWSEHFPFPIELTVRALRTERPQEALAQLPESVVAYRAMLGAMATLVVLPRPLVLALVAGILGDTVEKLPEDRELTSVEDSLCEFLFQQLFVAMLGESWPGAQPLTFGLGPRELLPRWTRMFALEEKVLVTTFKLHGSFGEAEWRLISPQKALLEQFALDGLTGPFAPRATPRPQLEALVREMPIDVAVTLGTLNLPIHQVTRLRPGDLLVLDQLVSEPLTASAGGVQKFRVWPGRVGARQACAIESTLEG